MSTHANEKLKLSAKLGFGAGDIFGGGSMVVISIFYAYFLTDVVLISPGLVGVVVLISKGWDAISDPIMGTISDRTRTKYGRRRPYFLAGVILVAISFFLLWYPVNYALELHRFIYVVVTYLFFSTCYTIVMIPYFALASEITTDYDERTSITSIRMVFSMVSSLICAIVPWEIVKMAPDKREGFVIMAVIFGLFFSLPYLATFFFTRERKDFQQKREPFNIKTTFVYPFKTPTFVNVLFMYLFSMTTLDVVMTTIVYYMTYYLGRSAETNYVLGVLLITQIFAIVGAFFMARRIGKKQTFFYATIYTLFIMAGSYLITGSSPGWIIYAFAFLVGIGTGVVLVMAYSIMPDVPDVDELYCGKRQEGIYSGLMTFLRKFGSAISIFIVMQVLQLAGYQKPIRETVNGVTKVIEQEQTDEFFLVLKLVFALVPAIFLLIAVYNTYKYSLTPETHNRLKVFLDRRRAGEEVSADEEQALKKLLEG